MNLEVLLSVMNLKLDDLDKMNITSKCTVINQCGQNDKMVYKNFHIYSYNEVGVSNSRNKGLQYVTEDIVLLCDDDVMYSKEYEKIVIDEFKQNDKADVIIFNIDSENREIRKINKAKRLHIYNSLGFASANIAFRKNSILKSGIKFNTLFGPNAKYNNGEDTLFIVDMLKNKLKIYACPKVIGKVDNIKSTWFKGYDEEYFFNKGALFTAISKCFRIPLILQYLIRHEKVLKKISFFQAYKTMLKGSNEYMSFTQK